MTLTAGTAAAPPERAAGRDFAIDLLRAIAILEVILAHADLPPLPMQLRNFGVPFLILLSGMAFSRSAAGKRVGWLPHMLKRSRKLLLPTWAFLTLFFAARFAIAALTGGPPPYALATIIDSYDLVNGIGYVWVIRVNLLMSTAAPLLLALDRRTRTNGAWIALCAAILTANIVVVDLGRPHIAAIPPHLRLFYANTIPYFFSYAGLFALGMRIERMPQKLLLGLALFELSLFVGLTLHYGLQAGHFVPTQAYKYPPHSYYLAYALALSLTLLALRERLAGLVKAPWLRTVLAFIGRSTLAIYLWHIAANQIVAWLQGEGLWPAHFLATWLLASLLAILAATLQKRVTARLAPALPRLRLRDRPIAAEG